MQGDVIRRWALAVVAAGALAAPAAADAAREPSHAIGVWSPGPLDTCPAELHDSYSVVGPDGKLYPTWHPPRVIEPGDRRALHVRPRARTRPGGLRPLRLGRAQARRPGARGRGGHPVRPRRRVARRLRGGEPGHADPPRGPRRPQDRVAERRRARARARPRAGAPRRHLRLPHQDPPGHALAGRPRQQRPRAALRGPLRRRHQADRRQAGDLRRPQRVRPRLRQDDRRSGAGTSHAFPSGGGVRLIPDRACVEEHVLVGGRASTRCSRAGSTRTGSPPTTCERRAARQLAYFDPHFAVFNPSRFAAETAGQLERTIDVCWETEPGRRRRPGAAPATRRPARARSRPRCPSTIRPRRSTAPRARSTSTRPTVDNGGGPRRWWTDPYGGNASREPLPGRDLPAGRRRRQHRPADARVAGVRRRARLRRPRASTAPTERLPLDVPEAVACKSVLMGQTVLIAGALMGFALLASFVAAQDPAPRPGPVPRDRDARRLRRARPGRVRRLRAGARPRADRPGADPLRGRPRRRASARSGRCCGPRCCWRPSAPWRRR